jgi:hypothetical protein
MPKRNQPAETKANNQKKKKKVDIIDEDDGEDDGEEEWHSSEEEFWSEEENSDIEEDPAVANWVTARNARNANTGELNFEQFETSQLLRLEKQCDVFKEEQNQLIAEKVSQEEEVAEWLEEYAELREAWLEGGNAKADIEVLFIDALFIPFSL